MAQEWYEALGDLRSGKLELRAPLEFKTAMRRFGDVEVSIRIERFRPHRSNAQNRFWHGVVIPAFADHCGYEFNEMKDALALELIPVTIRTRAGQEVTVPGHTSDLNTKEFNDLIERAQRLGATMGIYIPDPNEAVA